jgi:hypothetical protein
MMRFVALLALVLWTLSLVQAQNVGMKVIVGQRALNHLGWLAQQKITATIRATKFPPKPGYSYPCWYLMHNGAVTNFGSDAYRVKFIPNVGIDMEASNIFLQAIICAVFVGHMLSCLRPKNTILRLTVWTEMPY